MPRRWKGGRGDPRHALVVYPSLVVSTTEELAKPPISREQMAQAAQREMHSKVLLRAAELVCDEVPVDSRAARENGSPIR